MDQFDIEGMFNGTVGAPWMMPFGQQDANFLTGSRQMLEPIMEETSEDDEESILSYQHYENGAWSSESETGSVIRIELHNDQDSISERDFACPAKRARRDDILNINHLTIPTSNHLTQSNNNNNGVLPESPRKFNIRNNNELLTIDSDSLINPLSLSTSTSSSTNFRRRHFDDFIYSDSDSLSYNSLSRSSSLIQFESLERQLQNELSSSSIGSSPSLLSFDANIDERNNSSNRGSSSSLKRFESSDGRLHQTYLDLDKIDFDNTINTNVLFNNNTNTNSTVFRNINTVNTTNIGHQIDPDERHSKSDSESSSTDNSILSHEERILIRRPMNLSSVTVVNNRDQNDNLRSNKCKSSVENLSEDSGYCEHNNYSTLKIKSKSIPNFLRTTMNFNEKFYEEDEFENHKSLEELYCGSSNGNRGGGSAGGGGGSYSSADDDILLIKHSNNKENIKENIICDGVVSGGGGGSGQKQQIIKNHNKIGEKYNQNNNNNKMKNTKFIIEKSSSLSPPTSPQSWYNNKKIINKFSSISPSEEESSEEEGDIDDNDEDDDNDENDDDDSSDYNSASAQFTWNKNTNTIKTNLKNRNLQYTNNKIPSSDIILTTNFQYNSSSLPDIRVEFNNNNNTNNIISENCKNSINSFNQKQNKLLIKNENNENLIKNIKKNNLKISKKKYLSVSNNDLYNNLNNKNINENINNDKYLTTVSSVPKNLNLLNNNNSYDNYKNNNNYFVGDSNKIKNTNHCHDNNESGEISFSSSSSSSLNWIKIERNSENRILNENLTKQKKEEQIFNINPIEFTEFSYSGQRLNNNNNSGSSGGTNYINASYNNITLLDYSLTGPPSIIRPSINNRFNKKMSSTTSTSSSASSSDNDNNSTQLRSNKKRSSKEFDSEINSNNDNNNTKRNSRLTGEFELGKGNFLLDEISAHFDKNVSILSDRHCNSDLVSEFLENEKKIPPNPPIRRSSTNRENRYSANLLQGPTDNNDNEIKSDKTSLTTSHIIDNKIYKNNITRFDLDPTNLKTSYTESIERCNFNPNELSTSDLTDLKNIIHYQVTPIKRNFVASTPNLNEFPTKLSSINLIKNDIINNDNQISSTSNSLIQLPINDNLINNNNKKLGILMSTQSKNSLGKSVNFCPIVAEYSWHNKSDEIDNYEPDSLENLNNQFHDNTNDPIDVSSNSNVDPNITVTFGCDINDFENTTNEQNNIIDDERIERNNKNTTTTTTTDRIKRETTFGAIICSVPQIETTTIILDSSNVADDECKQLNFDITKQTSTTISNILNTVETTSNNSNVNAAAINNNNNINNNGANKKKFNKNSIKNMEININDNMSDDQHQQKQIIINNDNKIIDLTNNLMTSERLNNNNNYNSNINNFKSNNNNNINNNNGGSFTKNQQQQQQPQQNLSQSTTVPLNPINNPELLNKKFKPKPDEKHHKSFLSRFTGGFRFSLRRKKQKQLSQNNDLINNQNNDIDDNNKYNKNTNNNNNLLKKKSIADGAIKNKSTSSSSSSSTSKSSASEKSPDFIYIPLKGPIINNNQISTTEQLSQINNDNNEINNVVDLKATTNPITITADHQNIIGSSSSNNNNNNNNTSDGVKLTNDHVLLLGKPPLPKQPPRVVGVSEKIYQQQQQQQQLRAGQHAYRSSSQPRDDFDDNFNSYSFNNKSNSQEFLDNERRYYYNDYQLNGTMNGIGCNNIISGSGSSGGDNNIKYYEHKPPIQPPVQFLDKPLNNNNNNKKKICKIGLIETNLDTHETIISGKTRSLMELGPHYNNNNQNNNNQRHTLNTTNLKLNKNQIKNNQNIINNDDDDDDVCGPSVRRPHKSMEFLLDKENQKNIAHAIPISQSADNRYESLEARSKLRNTLIWKKEDSIVEKSPIKKPYIDESSSLTCWKTAMDIEEMLKHQKDATASRPSWIYKMPEIGEIGSSRPSTENSNFFAIDSNILRNCESPRRINRAYTLTTIEPPTPSSDNEKFTFDPRRLSTASILSTRSRCSRLPSTGDDIDSMKDLEWQPFDNKSLQTFKAQDNCKGWQNLYRFPEKDTQESNKDTEEINKDSTEEDKDNPVSDNQHEDNPNTDDSNADNGHEDIETEGAIGYDHDDLCSETLKAVEKNIEKLIEEDKKVTFDDEILSSDEEQKKVYIKTPAKLNRSNSYSNPIRKITSNDWSSPYDITKKSLWSNFTPISEIYPSADVWDNNTPSIWSRLENLYNAQNIDSEQIIDNKENVADNPLTINNEDEIENNAPVIDNEEQVKNNLQPSNIAPIEMQIIPKKSEFSKFWISCSNCKITFNIFHLPEEKLKTIQQNFVEKSTNCENLRFGIDGIEYPAKHFPKKFFKKQQKNDISIYWFAAGNFITTFEGEQLVTKKILQVFDLIKGSNLKFGIDEIIFSNYINRPESSSTQSKSPITEINIEKQRRISPCSKTSDLEQSLFDSDSDPIYLNHIPYSPIDSKTFTMPTNITSLPSTSRATPQESINSGEILNELDAMDELLNWCKMKAAETEKKFASPLNSPIAGAKFRKNSTTTNDLLVSKGLIADLLSQRTGIRQIQERVRPYVATNEKDNENLYIYSANENNYQYFGRLQNMVKAIQLIGKSGYNECTRDQLEGYMYTLCRYADFNLTSCITKVNIILDILLTRDKNAAEEKKPQPPENELQKSHDNTAALSEHQLRVQASLQRLNIPDWYRAYSSTPKPIDGQIGYKPGNFTRKRASDSGRWTGLNSKTTSLSSLGSQRSDRSPLLLSPSAHSHHGTTHIQSGVGVVGTNVNQSGGFSRWSTSYLNSTQTSPSVSQRGSFSRGGPINSSFSSAGGGVAGGSIRNSFRQPYMGWRSQEKINQPRTPHERLASSILAHKPPKPESAAQTAASAVTPEIQSSIKEVTSAIVHYVNDQNRTAPSRSRSTSPNSRKCWLESSFVGVRPLESPQTPTLENNSFTASQQHHHHHQSIQQNINNSTGYQQQQQQLQQQYHLQNYNSDILRVNGVGVSPLTSLSLAPERSPSSASLEDVLASLLGLPTESSSSYRSTGDTANEIIMFRVTQPTNKQHQIISTETTSTSGSSLQVEQQNRLRRRSEGDAQRQKQHQEQQLMQKQLLAGKINIEQHQQQQQQSTSQQQSDNTSSGGGLLQQPPRRVSLDSSESKTTSELLIKCRNTKCDQTTNPVDAKKYYKSCHNCSHLYCSRECRRAHWEKHRKACLHSRVSNLCRQVLSACKDDVDTLRHLSLLARKGYLSQGRGVVRILFRSPESAEGFIKNGFQCMGEASYVRWPDLMPAEMGIELYSELLRLSTEYKTDTKMLLYVAICVVSEAPGTATAPVKWERQLVSRCAKLKLCKSILNEFSEQNQQNNINQQQIAPEPSTEILILTFNLQSRNAQNQREIILQNILSVLNRRGVILKKHYPEIYQRLQTFADGQTERFMPVTLHPRDSQTGQGFVCIIMPNELIQLPTSDIGNRVCTIDVGEELLES